MPVNRTTRSRLVLACVAGVVALAGALVPTAVGVQASADAPVTSPDTMQANAVSLARAGEVVAWEPELQGVDPYMYPWKDVPAELDGEAVVQVVASPGGAVLALTAAGKVVGWGGDSNGLQRVPKAVKAATAAQVAIGISHAGVVTTDGRVLVWGQKPVGESALNVPGDLPPVKQLALADGYAVALTTDDRVVIWGNRDEGSQELPIFAVPEELSTPESAPVALAVVGSRANVWALTRQGTVVGWGKNFTAAAWNHNPWSVPAAWQIPGSVKAIVPYSYGGMLAVLADGTVQAWGSSEPASVAGVRDPVLIAGSFQFAAVVDGERVIHWDGGGSSESGRVPPEWNGRPIVRLALGGAGADGGVAVVTKLLRAERPAIAGSAQVGGVLTGTPGTFSASPTSVTSRWLAGGVVVGTGPSLTLTAGMAGQVVTYESTASKAGETTISSTSAPVTVAAAPAPAKTTPGVGLAVTKAPSMKKAGKATVTVRGGAVATGTVTVTASGKVKKGKRAKRKTFRATGVLVNGVVIVKIKKIKGAKGKWTLTATYAGDVTHYPAASSPVKIKVKKK